VISCKVGDVLSDPTDELHLTTVFVLIASRLDQGAAHQLAIHDKTWVYMRELINDLVFGKVASVGAVEALLLLSGEFSPFRSYHMRKVSCSARKSATRVSGCRESSGRLR